jgi:hypothetical protein
MKRSSLRLYGPFLAIAAVQALFIAIAPSKPAGQQLATVQGGGGQARSGAAAASSGAAGGAVDAAGRPIAAGGGSGGAGTGGVVGGGGIVGGGGSAGDITHCTGTNKEFQFDVLILHGPPCIPKWPTGADNGGATAQGVTADSIKIVYFKSKPNEQVDTILAAKGLATSQADQDAFYDAAFKFIQDNYEFYGRKLDIKRIIGDCPTTPPDYDKCNAAAQKVLEEHPYMVVWGTPLYADIFDVWAQNGIIAVGGWHFDDKYFNDRRPYRYDVFMDGTQSADFLAEYYCKKMANQPADHAGTQIHPLIGGRTTKRKLGLTVPEIPANVTTAQRVAAKVKECQGGVDVPIFTYKSDINTATQQTQSTVSGLIDARVTTVSCMCDPIAPVFLTSGMTSNGYFPEFLLPGLGLLDYDLLGQLYDPNQMVHAFGPSHLQKFTPLDETDAARVWRAEGHSGHPCGNNGCGIEWGYTSLIATMIQMAGPNLNPLTMEAADHRDSSCLLPADLLCGLLNLAPAGKGNPLTPLVKFGPGDYTAISDVKEVYWDPSATTVTDGSKGAYIPINDAQRYELGEFPSNGLEGIPVANR